MESKHGEHDRLHLQDMSTFQQLCAQLGYPNERVLFSDQVIKINKRGKAQFRILCVTDHAV